MTTRVDTPQARCKVGFARADITPPVGIYHRMWGAALHDRATGVHRPLTATAMCLEPLDGPGRLVVLGLDHCILDGAELTNIRTRVGRTVPDDVMVCLSHTHGSGWMSRTRAALPGGDLIGPYLDQLADACELVARKAAGSAVPATLLYGTAKCDLARQRDFYDADSKQFVCGFNPGGTSDDTALVAKAVDDATGETLGTVVNYACHPTTLAWENTLISPDYVGAMRAVVEDNTGAPCLFLQGASGDLGPKEGYVGDTAVADRNGRQLGFAALSALESLPPPGTHFDFAGPVVSGAILGAWKHVPVSGDEKGRFATWKDRRFVVALPYRLDLPKLDATKAELVKWEVEEAAALAADDTARVSECRARAEQMRRQITRLAAMPTGPAYPYRIAVSRLGDSVWVFCPGELYQTFQITLRGRFPQTALVIATVTNDWQPGYLPAASSYGYGIYQEVIAAVSPGALETVIEAVSREIRALLG
ncbi:MAG: neutral/alkaline non-lysosomal ceramidase N-terminal domain-containing protein [Planctomycetes bacterium]|nr:neutral/alkaline non-lysosomal ceramidase N-terminal domain-containing protein [Planctomycetota bacterium]